MWERQGLFLTIGAYSAYHFVSSRHAFTYGCTFAQCAHAHTHARLHERSHTRTRIHTPPTHRHTQIHTHTHDLTNIREYRNTHQPAPATACGRSCHGFCRKSYCKVALLRRRREDRARAIPSRPRKSPRPISRDLTLPPRRADIKTNRCVCVITLLRFTTCYTQTIDVSIDGCVKQKLHRVKAASINSCVYQRDAIAIDFSAASDLK